MTGFKPWISGIGSDRFASCDTTTAPMDCYRALYF